MNKTAPPQAIPDRLQGIDDSCDQSRQIIADHLPKSGIKGCLI
jgi:hypothetical protein